MTINDPTNSVNNLGKNIIVLEAPLENNRDNHSAPHYFAAIKEFSGLMETTDLDLPCQGNIPSITDNLPLGDGLITGQQKFHAAHTWPSNHHSVSPRQLLRLLNLALKPSRRLGTFDATFVVSVDTWVHRALI